MNMKLPKSLRDKDPMLSSLPTVDSDIEYSNHEWTTEELDAVDTQVQQELWEEAFIEACFEEMLAEEEEQWQHYGFYGNSQQGESHTGDTFYPIYQHSTDNQRQLVTRSMLNPEAPEFVCSKLNPDAPEFVPRGVV